MTYYNGNPYYPPTESAPLNRFAHDDCLPEDQFEMLPVNGVPTVRHQREPWRWSPVWGAPEPCYVCGLPVDTPPRKPEQPEPETDAEWLYGNSPGGLRMRAAEELAAEFGTDISEWTV